MRSLGFVPMKVAAGSCRVAIVTQQAAAGRGLFVELKGRVLNHKERLVLLAQSQSLNVTYGSKRKGPERTACSTATLLFV